MKHAQIHSLTHTYAQTKPNAVEQPSVKVFWCCRFGGIYIDRWWRDYGAQGLLITQLRRRWGTAWCHSSLQGWLFTLGISFVPFLVFSLVPSYTTLHSWVPWHSALLEGKRKSVDKGLFKMSIHLHWSYLMQSDGFWVFSCSLIVILLNVHLSQRGSDNSQFYHENAKQQRSASYSVPL